MKLDSSNTPIYLPQQDQDTVLRLGFENCPVEDWLFAADDLSVFYRHKTALGESVRQTCHGETVGSAKAQRELHDYLLQHLIEHPGLGYRQSDNQLHQPEQALSWEIEERNLWSASLWVAEDICLLEQSENDYIMTAASVCSPSNWFLEEKIGQTVDFIHGPVPNYDRVLSERVNRFLSGLRSGRVMLRYNWSIQLGNELCWRETQSQPLDPIGHSGAPYYWRVERQTFLRLPTSGAIVFGIRIFLHSFASLKGEHGFTESIASLLSQLPEAERRYKSLI